MRWVRFNIVGVLGFALQLATLSLLVRWTGLSPGLATAIAVLVTVSHNFLWHERFTWPGLPREHRLRRWAAFHVSTGLLSVVGNVTLTVLLMGATGHSVAVANVAAVAVMSVVNYGVSDRLVFRYSACGLTSNR